MNSTDAFMNIPVPNLMVSEFHSMIILRGVCRAGTYLYRCLLFLTLFKTSWFVPLQPVVRAPSGSSPC